MLPRGRGRGGGNSARTLSQRNTGKANEDNFDLYPPLSNYKHDQKVYCNFCPDDRAPMSRQTLPKATFCTNCNAAYHPGCVKKCHMNDDGSFVECCGKPNQGNDPVELENFEFLNSSVDLNLQSSNLLRILPQSSSSSDLPGSTLGAVLLRKLDSIESRLVNFSTRIVTNESDISKIKITLNSLNNKVNKIADNMSHSAVSSSLQADILTEQEERGRRANNLIVYNLPELNEVAPTSEEDRSVFFSKLNKFNKASLVSLASALDCGLSLENLFSRRLGKFVLDRTRPLLITLNNQADIKLVLRNIKKLKSIDKFNNIIVSHDLTSTQRTQLKSAKSQCVNLNSENNDPKVYWKVINSHSNPKIIKLSKNASPPLSET